MKAIRIHSYGGPEALKYEDAPVPAPIGPRLRSLKPLISWGLERGGKDVGKRQAWKGRGFLVRPGDLLVSIAVHQ